jgi:hypothetical protein
VPEAIAIAPDGGPGVGSEEEEEDGAAEEEGLEQKAPGLEGFGDLPLFYFHP